ncbi:MAG: tetratricopeptide repeat protein [Flavobacteriales bacterium]
MNQTDKAFQAAYEIFRNGKPAEAYAAFSALLKTYPHKGELHWYLAMACLQNGDPQKALGHMEQALFFEPGNANYISEMGVVHFHLKNRDLSLYHMDKALELEPKNPYRYSSRAYIRSSFGMVQEAIADYEKAVALDPEDSVAYNNLGLLQEQAGWNDKAQMNYRQADALEGLKNAVIQDMEAEEAASGTEQSPAYEGDTGEAQSLWRVMRDIIGKPETRREFLDFWKSKMKGK